MEIIINVVNQKLRLATNLTTYVSGSQNFVRFVFNLDESWDGLYPFAQFIQDSRTYNWYLDQDNAVYMPSDIQPGECRLVLYGTNNGVKAITDALLLTINDSMLVIDASSTGITPTLYEQLVSKVDSLATIDSIATVAETKSYFGIS